MLGLVKGVEAREGPAYRLSFQFSTTEEFLVEMERTLLPTHRRVLHIDGVEFPVDEPPLEPLIHESA